MKKALLVIAALGMLVGVFVLGRQFAPRPYDIQLTVDAAAQPTPSVDAERKAQAEVHVWRLQYLGSDDHPEEPPTATELAFFRACMDEEVIKARMQHASMEYDRDWGRWEREGLGEPSDPILRRAKKASHDLALAAQADEIKALSKRIEAMKALVAERHARLSEMER